MEKKRILSTLLALIMIFQIIMPTANAFADHMEDNIDVEVSMEMLDASDEKSSLKDTDKDGVTNYQHQENSDGGEENITHDLNQKTLEDTKDTDKGESEDINNSGKEDSKDIKDLDNDEEISESKDKNFTLEISKMTVGDEKVTEDYKLDPDQEFYIHYNWSLANNHGYKDGHIIKFKLPDNIKYEKMDYGELGDYGQFIISDDGYVKFIFNEHIEKASNIKGDFYVAGKLEKIESEVILIESEDIEGSLEISIDTSKYDIDLSKEAEALPLFSPKEIKWTITVDSKILMQNGGKIIEKLPEGLTYKQGSLEIDGKKSDKDFIEEGEHLSLELGSFRGKKLITFITEIDDDSYDKTSFKNNITYTNDKGTEKTASSNVSINRGKSLEKSYKDYKAEERRISWEVKINFNSKEVEASELIDTWEKGLMTLDRESLKLYEVGIDSEGEAELSNEVTSTIIKELTHSDSGFNFKLDKIDKPYILRYDTILKDRVTEKNLVVENKVKWNNEKAEATTNNEIGQKVINKKYLSYCYDKKEITWKIEVNQDKQLMKDLIIKDIFSNGGLEIIKDSIEIITGSGEILEIEKDYTIDISKEGFEINLTKDIKDSLSVTYTTKFDYSKIKDRKSGFVNQANISWSDEEGNRKNIDSEPYNFDPDSYTKENGNKSGEYNATDKEILWKIVVNYNKNEYTNLRIKDNIKGNQKLIDSSIEVYEAKIAGEKSLEKLDKVEPKNLEVDGNNLSIELGETNKPYILEYKTSLKGLEEINETYDNKAIILDGESEKNVLKSEVTIPNAKQYSEKSGKQKGKIVEWTVNINKAQELIKNAKLTDTLCENQEFIESSIRVYETSVDKDGNITKAKETEDVEIKVEGKTLTVIFSEDIERPYIVEYSTRFFAGNGEKISNSYELTADRELEKDSLEAYVTISLSSGGSATGVVGTLKVLKVDANNTEKLLEGAKFQLLDVDEDNSVVGEEITDKDGSLDFGRLLYGEYLLKEISAPEGYVKLEEPIKVTIPYEGNEEEKALGENTIVVKNNEFTGALKIIKHDEENEDKRLQNALFDLLNNNEVIEEGLKTDENGEIVIENLKVGKYVLLETKAPQGYKLDKGKIEFEISKDQEEIKVIKISNVKKVSDLKIKKIDKDSKKTLEGAQFKVFKLEDEIETLIKNCDKDYFTTDENGEILVELSEEGNYKVIEIKAPKGYNLDKKDKVFEIKSGEEKELVVENKKKDKPTTPENPEKPEEPNKPSRPSKPEEPNKPEEPTKPENPDKKEELEEDVKKEILESESKEEVKEVEQNQSNNDKTHKEEMDSKDFDVDQNNAFKEKTEKEQKSKEVLPKTGSRSMLMYRVIGVVFILIALYLRKKEI